MKVLGRIGLIGALGLAATVLADPDPSAAVSTEAVVHARTIRDEAVSDAQHVVQLQQMARHQKDFLKLTCLNDKLVQMKPQLNIIEQYQINLEAASGDSHMAMSGIVQAGENVRSLREQADGCVGESLDVGTESSNSYTAPPIADNPYQNVWGTEIEAPAYASPFN